MAINEADKSKLVTLGGLSKFFGYLKEYLAEKVFSRTHFSKKSDNNYIPGTDGLIDVKLGRMLDDGVGYEAGKGNYNTVIPKNSSRFLTNGQTIVNVVNGEVSGENKDNNKTLNKTGLGQIIPNTHGLTVSNSVFKARGAEIDWTANGRSWDTLNYFLSPGIYTINYKVPKAVTYEEIPESIRGTDQDPKSYHFSKFNNSKEAAASAYTLNNEFGGGGLDGLNIPREHGAVVQIRLTVTTVLIGSNKERLRVYQQAQMVTSKQDKLARDINFHDGGDIYIRIGEGPSSLSNKNFTTELPDVFFGSTNSKYVFTSWRSITSSSITKIYQPIKVAAGKESENQYSRIKFQDGGVFTLTPIDYSRQDGKYIDPLGDVRNHKQIDILLPDLSTMTSKKPQKCTLYVYNYADVIGQYIRLYIEQPKLLKAKLGNTVHEYLSHDVMCSVQLDRYINQFTHRNQATHTRYWFTTVQWGQLRCWYNSTSDKTAKYRVLRYAPHYERDWFSIPDQIWEQQKWNNNSTKASAFGGANGVYKIDITILHVDNMMPARNAKGEYIHNYSDNSKLQRNFKVCTATKYYHILTSIEYLGPLDPTFNTSANKFEGVYQNAKQTSSTLKGISCYYNYVEGYGRRQASHQLHLDGSITDAEKINHSDNGYYGFALLEDWGSNGFADLGEADYDQYHEDPNITYNYQITK